MVLAMAVTIPQELKSVEQTVIDAVPLVVFAVKVRIDELMLVLITLEFELLKT